MAESQWKRYRRQGKCGRCGKKPRPGLSTCEECGVKDAERSCRYQRLMRARWSSFEGLCTRCGEAAEKGKRCRKCLQRHRVMARRQYKRNINKERKRKVLTTQRIRDKRRAQGLCVECGAESPEFFRCILCRRRRAENRRKAA